MKMQIISWGTAEDCRIFKSTNNRRQIAAQIHQEELRINAGDYATTVMVLAMGR